MHELRLSPEAEADLDAIWIHIARESGSIDVATRIVERISDRFWLRPGLRSFAADDYVIIYFVAEDRIVLLLHIIHGSRDIDGLLGY